MLSKLRNKKKNQIPKIEKQWARRAHLSTLLMYPLFILPIPNYWIGFFTILFPASIGFFRRRELYSRNQAWEAMYFHTIISIGHWGISLSFSSDRVLFVFSTLFLAVLHLFFVLIAVIKTSFGGRHSYPFSFIPHIQSGVYKNHQTLPRDKAQSFDKEMAESFQMLTDLQSHLEDLGRENSSLEPQTQDLVKTLETLKVTLDHKPEKYRSTRPFFQTVSKQLLEILEKQKQLSSQPLPEDHSQQLRELLAQTSETVRHIQSKIQKEEWELLNIQMKAIRKNLEYGGF